MKKKKLKKWKTCSYKNLRNRVSKIIMDLNSIIVKEASFKNKINFSNIKIQIFIEIQEKEQIILTIKIKITKLWSFILILKRFKRKNIIIILIIIKRN